MQNNKSIGSLWEAKGKNGNIYYKGFIKHKGIDINIVVFKNFYKKGSEPDYVILESGIQPNNAVSEKPKKPKEKTNNISDDTDLL